MSTDGREIGEVLDAFEQALLELERGPKGTPDALGQLLRTVRGLERSLTRREHPASSALVQEVQRVLATSRDPGTALGREEMNLLFMAVDTIRAGAQGELQVAGALLALRHELSEWSDAAQRRAREPEASGPEPGGPTSREGAAEPSARVQTPRPEGAPRSPRILVVDDDLVSRTLMLGLLRGYGKCAVAVNGREAIQAIVGGIDRREAYDVVCLDIMMPEVDGVGVLRALRDAEACAKIGGSDRAKVLMTTALGDFDHQFSACAAACDAYLTKPISKLVLQRQLARLGYAPPE